MGPEYDADPEEYRTVVLDPPNGTDPVYVPEVEDEPVDSPFGGLQRRYQALQRPHYKFIDIPGWGGDLVGRYTPIDDEKWKTARRANLKRQEDDRHLGVAIEYILGACESLWYRDPQGDLQPIDAADPVRFDDRLAEKIGFEPKNDNAKVLREMFKVDGRLNADALTDHANDISTWASDVSQEVDDTFEGEA